MSKLVEFHRYRVTVEVPIPREDWLTRLEGSEVGGCTSCGGELPERPIYLNTEGRQGGTIGEDELCSWACLLELAAGVVATTDEPYESRVTVDEIPDWRGTDE